MIFQLDDYRISKMSVVERLRHELNKNSNILFNHEYAIIEDDDKELILYEINKNETCLIAYLLDFNKLVVNKSSIILVDDKYNTRIKLSKNGSDDL